MIINILTRGWILRVFIMLLWLIAVLGRLVTPEAKFDVIVIAVFIVFANGFLYLALSFRLIMLTHQSMSRLLPNYFSQLKVALLTIFLISLLPTLLLLPDVIAWFAVLSALVCIAVIFVTLTYKTKLNYGICALFFLPSLSDNLPSFMAEINLALVLAWSFPLIAWGAYLLLNRLESYHGNADHISKIIAMNGLNVNKPLLAVDDVPVESQNRCQQWLIKSNLNDYVRIIRSSNKLSHRQLIAVTAQGLGSIGRSTYLSWAGILIAISLLAKHITGEHNAIILLLPIIFPTVMLGMGHLNLFQVINKQKGLLKRLSIMPCFNNKHSFSIAFIRYIIAEQLKLYSFIALVFAVFTYLFQFITFTLYVNILAVTASVFLVNLALMFWCWSNKQRFEGIILWLMLAAIIFCIIYLVVIADQQVFLWQSSKFIAVNLLAVSLFSISAYQSYHRGLREL